MAYKVLLADDSVPAQNMGKKILIDAGYDVLTVSNGLEALRKIADTMPDIAILDIFMPGYTGLEICERLRAKAATAELPVILTVGKLEPYRPGDGKQVGSNAVIVKPFAAAELIAAVRSLIGVKRAEVVYSAEEPPPAHIAAPIQEDFAVTDEKPLSAALAEIPAGGSDEPLFAQVESAAAGNAAPSALENPGAGVAAVESLVAEEPGPESLVFNPDAGHTPFSASVSEATPVEWDLPAEAEPSVVGEFDLESEATAQDSAEPFQGGAAVESWHIEPDAAAPITTHIVKPYDASEDAQMASPEPAAMAAEPAAAIIAAPAESEEAATLKEVADAAVPAAEPDSSPQEEPIFEPPVEVREQVAPADVAASETDAGGLPELILLEDGVADGEDFTAAMDEPVTREEEARRRAFEDLFNSDVPFPLEEPAISIPAPEMVALPSVSESSKQEFGEIELEPEIAMGDLQDTSAALAPGPEAWQAPEPASAVDPLFERETLLEDYTASSDPSVEIEQPPVEDVSSVLGDSYTVRPDVISQSMGQLDAQPPAEEPETPVAAAPVEAAPVEPVAPVEKEIPAPVVASPERSDLVAEVAKVEALLVQMQAVRQVGEASHSHTETEFEQPEAAPYLQSYGGAAAVESAPLEATEEPAIEAAAVPVPVEPELQEVVVAPLPPEPEVEPELVSSPLETTPEELANARAEVEDEPAFVPPPEDDLNDAERIHKAVERVFDRFRPLLVAAIVRELIRRD